MIISLKVGADPARVVQELAARGLWVERVARSAGAGCQLVIAEHSCAANPAELSAIDGVLSIATSAVARPLVERQGPSVEIAGVRIGPLAPTWMCGPCSVESEAHAREIAARLAPMGVAFLRGGAWKPRTSPYAFQGHGEQALVWLRRGADSAGLRLVTEALGEADVPLVAEYADLVQVGSRNMHNYALLRAVGRARRPALLKRGMAATLEEWLLAGEYLLESGSPSVVFCERGVRSFDHATRNLLDLGAVALLAHVHRVPVVVDPSHAAGRRDLVAPLARAALAAGASGLMIEAHDDPGRALSDGPQALATAELEALIRSVERP